MSEGPRQGSLYDLLGVAPDASADAVSAAITAQRRVWRRRTTAPDIIARQEAERRMQALDDAERTLLEPARRSAYDARLAASGAGSAAPPDAGALPAGGATTRPGPPGRPGSPFPGPAHQPAPSPQAGPPPGAPHQDPPHQGPPHQGPPHQSGPPRQPGPPQQSAPPRQPGPPPGPQPSGRAGPATAPAHPHPPAPSAGGPSAAGRSGRPGGSGGPAGAGAHTGAATPAEQGTSRRRDAGDDRWLVRAVEQLGQQQYDVATFTARRAVEADPENGYAWSVLAEAAARSGDPRTAADAVERALCLDPESAALHAQRGWILERAGDHARAHTAYLSAARLAPSRPEYRVRAVQALLRAGKVDEAVADAEAAYQARPDDGEIRTALAAALGERAVAAQHELPDGQLVIASASQASYVLALANRGLSVQPPDPAVVLDLERQRDYARRAMRRRFSLTALKRNYRWPVGLGLLSLAVLCCAPTTFGQVGAGGLGTYQLTFLLSGLAVIAAFLVAVGLTCFEPRHRRNARLVENTVPRRRGRGPGEPPRTR